MHPHLPAAQTTPPRARVLVVDDDTNTLDAMEQLLSDDYDVEVATNATDAARIARDFLPDAVVSDLNMPGVDGLALVELLCADRCCSPPPLLIVSANGDRQSRNRALERGAFDYLTKPVDVTELLVRLARAVRHGQERRGALVTRLAALP